jgi:hypothetical protein
MSRQRRRVGDSLPASLRSLIPDGIRDEDPERVGRCVLIIAIGFVAIIALAGFIAVRWL